MHSGCLGGLATVSLSETRRLMLRANGFEKSVVICMLVT